MAFEREFVGDFEVSCELAPVVGGDGLYPLSVGVQQPDDGLCRCVGLASILELFDEQEVSGAFREGEDGVSVVVDDGVHFPVSVPFAVSLFWPVVD